MSEYSPKITRRPVPNVPDVNNSMQKPHQLSTMYCAIWLVDFWPITILVKYISVWLLNVVHFSIENNSNKSTSEFHFLFSFSFWHLENNEINGKKFGKRPLSCRYFLGDLVLLPERLGDLIWCKTWRLQGKPGELAGMIHQSTPVWCYLQSLTCYLQSVKCLFSAVWITVSSHNFKLQNY